MQFPCSPARTYFTDHLICHIDPPSVRTPVPHVCMLYTDVIILCVKRHLIIIIWPYLNSCTVSPAGSETSGRGLHFRPPTQFLRPWILLFSRLQMKSVTRPFRRNGGGHGRKDPLHSGFYADGRPRPRYTRWATEWPSLGPSAAFKPGIAYCMSPAGVRSISGGPG